MVICVSPRNRWNSGAYRECLDLLYFATTPGYCRLTTGSSAAAAVGCTITQYEFWPLCLILLKTRQESIQLLD